MGTGRKGSENDDYLTLTSKTQIGSHKREGWEKWVGTRQLRAFGAYAKEIRGHRRFLSKGVTQPPFSFWRLIWQQCGVLIPSNTFRVTVSGVGSDGICSYPDADGI